ncbi:MAG: TRAP transporter small permease [Pseudomonadota bacterium]|jgi:TRAP-type C4-dicarboxylate transport system permease small subunit
MAAGDTRAPSGAARPPFEAPRRIASLREKGGAMIRKFLDGLYLLSGILAGCFLVAIFLLMMALSLGREVGLNVPAGDDFASWSMAAMAFLGLAHTFKHGEMIRVGLILERLRGPKRRYLELFCLLVGVSFIGYFALSATRLTYDSYRFFDISQGVIAVPLWIPQSGYTLGLWVLLIAMLDELIHVLRGNAPRYEKEPAATPDELVERIASGGGV